MARRTPSAEPRSGEKRARGGSDAKRRAPVREAAPRTGFSARQNLNALLVCVAIVAASFVVYGQLAHHAFIHFDDDLYIYQNPHVVSGLSWSNVAWALTEYRSNTWHPMAWISHMLDCQLFGLDAGKHHMMSVWIHTLNSVLLLLLLRRLTGSLWRSAVVAAFFAVHPMHVESVAWASERKDVLSMLFALLAIWAYSGYARRPGAARYVLTLAMVALAIMSKPMMVTLPFVLLLLDYWPLRRFGWPTASARSGGFRASLIIDKLPMLALAGGAAVLTMMAERGLQQHTLWMRLTTALVSLMKYAGKLLVPLTQAFYYPYPSQPPVLPALGCALVLVGVTWWFIHIRRTHPYALVGWLWYLGTLAPVIGLEQVATHAMADRYTRGLANIAGLRMQRLDEGDSSTYKDFTIAVESGAFGCDRDALVGALKAEGIDTRNYFDPPVHRQQSHASALLPVLAVTDRVAKQVVSLPIYPALSDNDIDRICAVVQRVQQQAGDVRNKLNV